MYGHMGQEEKPFTVRVLPFSIKLAGAFNIGWQTLSLCLWSMGCVCAWKMSKPALTTHWENKSQNTEAQRTAIKNPHLTTRRQCCHGPARDSLPSQTDAIGSPGSTTPSMSPADTKSLRHSPVARSVRNQQHMSAPAGKHRKQISHRLHTNPTSTNCRTQPM